MLLTAPEKRLPVGSVPSFGGLARNPHDQYKYNGPSNAAAGANYAKSIAARVRGSLSRGAAATLKRSLKSNAILA